MLRRILFQVLTFCFVLTLVGIPSSNVYGQKKRKPAKSAQKPPKNPEDAAKMEAEKEKDIDRKIRDKRREYKKSLSKKDRKRMKRNRKKSDRHGQNRKEPFLQRLFSKKHKRGARRK